MIALLFGVPCLTVPLLPIAVAIITAGLAVLAGPFLVQPIPESLRESHFAPLAVVLISLTARMVLPAPY